jgi:molecular chaperone GrpE
MPHDIEPDDIEHDDIEPDDIELGDIELGDIELGASRAGQSELTELEIVAAERDQFKDIALRLQADFENYRKRVSMVQSDEVDRATGRLAESLLAVLDACEAAFAHGVEGIEPIWSQLMGVLQKQGLEAMDLAEKPFDPTHAEAVLHEPAQDADSEAVISEVLRTGYQWKGKVLRPAMVKVRG